VRGRPFALAAVAVLAAGCGSGRESSTTASSTARDTAATAAPGVESCVKPSADTHITKVAALGGPIVTIGSGTTVAVMANQDGGTLCGWLPLARGLAHAGIQAAVFDYVGAASDEDVLKVAQAVRSTGARHVVLVGASTGGRVVLHAAALHPGKVAAVVTLSAEKTGRSGYPTPTDARDLRAPALYVGTTNDGYTTFGAETRSLYRATRAPGKRLLLISGSEHGTDILAGRDAQRVIATITRFVQNAG
jgi:pimeloyl-ACP methyl ester carboxylesterase